MRLPSHADALTGTRAQYALLAEAVAGLPDDAFAMPTRLEGWNVAALVVHVARTANSVANRAQLAAPGKADTDVLDYLAGMREVAERVAEAPLEKAASMTPGELRDHLAAAAASTDAAEGVDLAHVVAGYSGTLTYGDFLLTRCVEGVVHGLDLRHATGVPAVPDPAALKVVVRLMAALVERRAPGRSVELRVPGHVAFQCIAGPRHTRGTPGNVVEADPVAFVEVAAGRRAWAGAVAMGAIRGSGKRADLTEFLPVIG